MKLHIFYRLSDKGNRKNKPDYINLENCFKNFCSVFSDCNIIVVADNIEESTYNFLSSHISKERIHLTKLGNSGSFRYALDNAISNFDDEDIIYFVEDDYVHIPDSNNILLEGFKYADYVSLYDHPDKYTIEPTPNPFVSGGGENTKVFVTDSVHWKLTNSTCMTFATKVKTLKEDRNIIIQNLTGIIPSDFKMFIMLYRDKKRKLVTPIPGCATHGQNPWLAKLVNWEEVMETSLIKHMGVVPACEKMSYPIMEKFTTL